MRNRIITALWALGNFAAIGMLAFCDILLLRIIGWIWISLAVTMAGLVELGGFFGSKNT